MEEEKKEEEFINYQYINKTLVIAKDVPATVLLVWLFPIISFSIFAFSFAIISTILLTIFFRKGYNIIELVSIVRFVLRDKKFRLFKEEEKYEK